MPIPWLAIAAASSVVSAGASIYGGISSANAARSEGTRARNYAATNAHNQIVWGQQQASLSAAAAQYNAELMQRQAGFNIQQNQQAVEYNVNTLNLVNGYNSLLADEELRQVYQQHGLEEFYLHTDLAIAKGAAIGRQAISGTVIGEGSNQDVVNSLAYESAIANLVLDTQAYETAIGIQNEVAKGNWETTMAINKVLFEGEQRDLSTAYNAAVQGQSAIAEAFISGNLAQLSAANRAEEIRNAGAQQSAAQNTQADMYFIRGLTSGAQSAVQGASLLA